MIKVVHILSGLGAGGAEYLVLNLVQHTSDKEVDFDIIGLSSNCDIIHKFEELGYRPLALSLDKFPFRFFRELYKCHRLLKRSKTKVLHAHMFHGLLFAVFLKLLNLNRKIVYTSHSYNVGSLLREWFVFATKFFRSKDIVFSKDMINFSYIRDSVVIPNGVDFDRFKPDVASLKKFTFINIGRLEPVKNHRVLIEHFAQLKNIGYNVELVIVGEGFLRRDLELLVSNLDVDDSVRLVGLQDNISEFLQAAHCFVLSSKWEGLPLSILEAIAAGVPVISTPVGSIPTTFSVEEIIFTPEEEIVGSLKEVYVNYDVYKRRSMRLVPKMRSKFDIRHLCLAHLSIYSELGGGKVF